MYFQFWEAMTGVGRTKQDSRPEGVLNPVTKKEKYRLARARVEFASEIERGLQSSPVPTQGSHLTEGVRWLKIRHLKGDEMMRYKPRTWKSYKSRCKQWG